MNEKTIKAATNKGFCNIGADGITMSICNSILLLFGQTSFNLAFCCYLHHQFFNWASVLGGRFSNSPTSQSPTVAPQSLRDRTLAVRQQPQHIGDKMNIDTVKKYLLNCFLLTLPIMVWNILLSNKLPKEFQSEIFWKDIPSFLMYGENISRTIVFMLILIMPLSISTITQKKGLFLYVGGTMLYFASWLALIYFPRSGWSNNIFGFMAPAYTPLLWLMGIGLIGNSFYFNLPYRRWFFILISIVFLIFHNFHTITIYFRTH